MDAFLAHWWIFPASILFSTVALASGVSGALFFSPFFLLVVGLEPAQAIGAGLLTEVFGMGNGLRSYVKQGLVDYATAKWLLIGGTSRDTRGQARPERPDGSRSRRHFRLRWRYRARDDGPVLILPDNSQ